MPARIAAVMGSLICLALLSELPLFRPIAKAMFGVPGFAQVVVLPAMLLGLIALPLGFIGWLRRPAGNLEIAALALPLVYWTGFIALVLSGGFS